MQEVDLLVDTSVLVDFLRGYDKAKRWAEQNQNLRIGIPIFVWMEIIGGAKNQKDQLTLQQILDTYAIVYLDELGQKQAKEWLLHYNLGNKISPFDCLIAATAFRVNKKLCTRDSDFASIDGLQTIQPY